MTDAPRVALVHSRDARDVRSWSGTLSFSKAAFHRHVGPVTDLSPAPVNLLPFRIARKLVLATTGRTYGYDHEPILARYYGWYFSRHVARVRPDLVFAPAGSSAVAYLKTEVPIVYFTDGPWSAMRGYQKFYQNSLRRTDRAADEMERAVLRRSAVVLVSSEWAREAVVRDYGIDPSKVHTVWIGANLPDPPAREEVLPRRPGGKVRLLLVGTLWELKGGDIAREALVSLLEMGCDAELTVVGCTPPEGASHPRMRIVPSLNKSVPAERAEFDRLWREADFFVLPSRSEAAGVVFCEAGAYGLPSLATRTGGIPSLVAEGRNGFTLPPEARGSAYARRIAEIVRDPEGYARLCETSRDEFEQRLNWDAWGESVARILADALPHLRERIGAHARPARPDGPRRTPAGSHTGTE